MMPTRGAQAADRRLQPSAKGRRFCLQPVACSLEPGTGTQPHAAVFTQSPVGLSKDQR